LAFTGTCLLILAALATNRFRGWMLAPLGITYVVWLFFPCYFRFVNRVRPVRVARNVLFAIIAILCLGIAVGIFRTDWMGL
jgi:hypothetical protein